MMLRTHCQTSGWSLIEQEPENNITRTCVEALAAILGGTQSLHTNAYDEAIALPTEHSAKIARDTQLFLQKNSKICDAIDPFAGSYYIESLTNSLITKSKKIINEIEKLGGMSNAIEQGIEQGIYKSNNKLVSQFKTPCIKVITNRFAFECASCCLCI